MKESGRTGGSNAMAAVFQRLSVVCAIGVEKYTSYGTLAKDMGLSLSDTESHILTTPSN